VDRLTDLFCTRQGSNLQPYDRSHITISCGRQLLRKNFFSWKSFDSPSNRSGEIIPLEVKAYIRPIERTGGIPAERLLLEWINQLFCGSGPGVQWQCSATEIHRFLTAENSPVSSKAKQILPTGRVTGIYLGRLAELFPYRFSRKHTLTENIWTIRPAP
jgi:hypothetical protein